MSHHGAHANPQSNDDLNFVDFDTDLDLSSIIPAADATKTTQLNETSDWSTKPTSPESRIIVGGDDIPLVVGERVWNEDGLSLLVLSIDRTAMLSPDWLCRDSVWCSFRNQEGMLDYDRFNPDKLFHQPVSNAGDLLDRITRMDADKEGGEPDRLFAVIDTRTNTAPNLKHIALYEPWAKRLVWCDMDGFYLDEFGTLLLADECGNYVICPEGRFEIRFSNLATA